ncbi:fmp21p [Myxozyma melibiosi]|uniref:Succinate dehydrogenase assembly factor 4, mitochondrial n=1 Tax=Myxozyma melibiosi TaxID=54550 RepID=A0ABR1F6R9_9ASCO
MIRLTTIRHTTRALRTLARPTYPPMLLSPLTRSYADFSAPRPAPPRLPEEEQEEFERLLKKANAPFAAAEDDVPEIEVDVETLTAVMEGREAELSEEKQTVEQESLARLRAMNVKHADYVGRTIPEFEGDVNPKTGEVGGPKQDPLRHGDYSFNGRVTDF